MIIIVSNCRFYETDYERISYYALLKLCQMYHQNHVHAEAYVFDALRRGYDEKKLFWGCPLRYKTVREYGVEGLESLRVFDNSRFIEMHVEDVNRIPIIDDYKKGFWDIHRKTFIIGCRVYYDYTPFAAFLKTDEFEYEKLEFLASEGIDEMFRGSISFDPDYVLYDNVLYSTEIMGVSDIATQILKIRYIGIVFNYERDIVLSVEDTLGNILEKMAKELQNRY